MTLAPGVHSVLVTPFTPHQAVDEGSVRSLVGYCVGIGVDGVLALGVMGEAGKLSDAERERVQAATIEAAAGRTQVTVGVTHASTAVTRERARAAARAGADGVMVSPPPETAAGPALREHFRRVAEGLDAPVVVQDYPAGSGVVLPVDFLASLADDLPPGSAVKLEDPPTAPKIARLRAEAPSLRIFGGLGGVSLLEELEAGAEGTMTGFALPDLLVEIVGAHEAGDIDRARAAFEAALPLLVFEAQPVVGLALRKEILRRRGAIAHATIRAPGPALDKQTLAALDRLLGARL